MTTQIADLLPEALAEGRALGEILRSQRPHRQTAPVRRKTGRPTRLHRDLIDRICGLIREGNYQETAAIACGVPASTYHSWKARGIAARQVLDASGRLPDDKADERIFLEFVEAVEEARAEAEARIVESLQRQALGGEVLEVSEVETDDGEIVRNFTLSRPDWRAQAWWLERSFPERYGRRVEVSGPDQGPIAVEVEVSARDLIRRKLNETRERIDGPATEGVDGSPSEG